MKNIIGAFTGVCLLTIFSIAMAEDDQKAGFVQTVETMHMTVDKNKINPKTAFHAYVARYQ